MSLAEAFKVEAGASTNFEKSHGSKIAERLRSDPSASMLKSEIEREPGENFTQKAISHIIKGSPHPKYNGWLVKQYASGGIPRIDDADKAKHGLRIFHKHTAKINPKDIYQVRDLNHLQEITEPYEKVKTGSENSAEMHNQAHIIYDSPEHKILIPKTEEASKYFGANTKWCTAAKNSRNYFKTYNGHGNLFYFLHKPTNKKFAVFFPHDTFKEGSYAAPEGFDEKDKAVPPWKIIKHFDDAADYVTHFVEHPYHRITAHLPIPDPGWAPKESYVKDMALAKKMAKEAENNNNDGDEDE